MNLDKLPFNAFDLVLVAVLVAGVLYGRKHGMSEELLNLIKWLTILFACATLYEPVADLFGQFTSQFSRLTCFLLAYAAVALVILVVFAGLCAMAIAFIFWFLPETKGLPVEEIVRVFERQQKQPLKPAVAPQ